MHDAEPLVLLDDRVLQCSPHVAGEAVEEVHLPVAALDLAECCVDLVVVLVLTLPQDAAAH